MFEQDQALYDRAVKRLKEKQGVVAHLLVYVLVNAFLVAIWAMNDRGGAFWPMYPIVGWGIAVVLHLWAVYAGEPSEEAVREEMERLKKRAS